MTISKPWGQGLETATGLSWLAAWMLRELRQGFGDVRGAVGRRLRGQWSSRDQRDDMAAASTSEYCTGQRGKMML